MFPSRISSTSSSMSPWKRRGASEAAEGETGGAVGMAGDGTASRSSSPSSSPLSLSPFSSSEISKPPRSLSAFVWSLSCWLNGSATLVLDLGSEWVKEWVRDSDGPTLDSESGGGGYARALIV